MSLRRELIIAASKAYGDAMVSSKPQIQELVNLYAMIGRMRVHARHASSLAPIGSCLRPWKLTLRRI
jgi:hypothetical protein